MDAGDRFPAFSLKDENDELFDSSALEGIRYVIYFYPKDGTPGCTKEAESFSADFPQFMLRNIPVIGVSRDSPESHRRFIDGHGLKVKLLSDPDHRLMEEVGAWGPKVSYGKETVGVIRSTFLVGKDGIIEAAWRNVRVDGHADKVLASAVSFFKKSQRCIHGTEHIAGIGQKAEVGESVYGRGSVAVHSDDLPCTVHTHTVLDGARYPECDVDVGGHNPSGQAHLAGAGHPSLLHERAGAADLRIHLGRDRFRHSDQRAVFDAVSESYENARLRYVIVGFPGDVLRYRLDIVARILPVDGGPLALLLLRPGEGTRADGRHLREPHACDIGNQSPSEGGTGGYELPSIHPEVCAISSQAGVKRCRKTGSNLASLLRSREQYDCRLGACSDLAYAVGVRLGHVRRFDPLVADVVERIYPVSEELGVQRFDLRSSEDHSEHTAVGHLGGFGC